MNVFVTGGDILNDELALQDAKNVAKGIDKACSKIGMGLALCSVSLILDSILGLLSGDKSMLWKEI